MTHRKRKKTLHRKVRSIVGAGVGIGVGTLIVSKAGGSSVLPAFRTAGGLLRPVATATLGLYAIKGIKKLHRKRKKRKNKWNIEKLRKDLQEGRKEEEP